ncbi:MAG: hypothetical protein ACLQU2_18725 [Candidatus Binataceae bacterium]
MNPIKIDYRIACVGGMLIGAVLLVIAITTSHPKPHVGLAAWGIWVILCSVLLLIMRAADSTLQASDAEDGQTIGFAFAHVGAIPILVMIVTGVAAAVITAIFGT